MNIAFLKRAGFLLALLSFLSALSCSKSVGERLAEYQEKMAPHVGFIFADAGLSGGAETLANKARVRDIHKIAALVELYREKTGNYPLGRKQDMSVIFRNPDSPYGPVTLDAYGADPAEFEKELEAALGPVEIPVDRHGVSTGQYMDYAFSRTDSHYVVATYLTEQPHYAEEVVPGQFQYRVGSAENETLPVLLFSKLVEGGYNVTPPKKYKRGQ